MSRGDRADGCIQRDDVGGDRSHLLRAVGDCWVAGGYRIH
jgi:hypothetical protein